MMLFRRSSLKDLSAIHELAIQSGIGMTTLPKDINLLEKRVRWSDESFRKDISHPENEYYLFVLEDPLTQKVVGTSAVESCIGAETPFYSYKISRRTRISHELNIRSDYEILTLVNDNQGKSEICTLFLTPEQRINANGLLLSRARFLFMAQCPHRFSENIIAEMRGVSNDEGLSPFWEHIGKHFFKMSFVEADRLTLSTNKQYIADLMPRNPIYVSLLPKEAQAVIGQPHESTAPALNILKREGFRYNEYVDIFDGGPTIEAPIEHIKTITASQILTISDLSDDISSRRMILANTSMDYRATLSQAVVHRDKKTVIISKDTATLLQLNIGDKLRLSPLSYDHE